MKQPATEISPPPLKVATHQRSHCYPAAIVLPLRMLSAIIHYVMNGRVRRIATPPNGLITRSKLEKNLFPVDQNNLKKENNSGYSIQAYEKRQYWIPNGISGYISHHLA